MKKMGKVVAVLAGLSMMFTGVGTAYADDAAGDAAASQSQTATADAAKSQAQADATADQNAKQSAKTPAPAAADQKQAEPKAQAKAAAADGAQISKVVAPSTALKYGANYSDANESAAFKVTLTGLTIGKAYGVMSTMNEYNGLPASGQTVNAYDYNAPVFTASAKTQTIDVFYRGLYKPSSTVQFALVAGDKVNVDNWGNKSVTGTVVDTSGGVQVKVLDVYDGNLVTLDSQSVEDVGEHTVGLKAHYTIDPKIAGSVTKVCYSTTVTRVFTVSGTFDPNIWAGGGYRGAWDCVTGAISDEDPEIGNIFKVNNLIALAAGGYDPSHGQTAMGQWFNYGHTLTAEEGKSVPASGEIENVVPGLLANTKYGNWGYSPEEGEDIDGIGATDVIYGAAKSQTTQPDPASLMYSGIVLTFDDGSMLVPGVSNGNGYTIQPKALMTVEDFTTAKATNGPVASDDLTDANKNGVEGVDGNKANAGSVYRLYIDSLKESATCKALVEKGSYCYWTGYIYSTPKQLASPDGKSSAVRVGKDGKAYVEFNIPADTVNGDHKIALYDNDGKLLGWTPVTVAKGQAAPEKPSAADVAALQSAIKTAESKKQADYTAASWSTFAAALKAAQDVAGKSDATKAEVTAATAALNTAVKGLVKAGSTTPTKPTTSTKPTDNKKPVQNNTINKKSQQKLANTGSGVLAVVLVVSALAIAGVSAAIYRRRNA